MNHSLIYVANCCRPDRAQQVGQVMLRPFSLLFGRSFVVIGGVPHESPSLSTLNKAVVVALSILLGPITLLAALVGLVLLSYSTTHRNQCALIDSQKNHPVQQSAVQPSPSIDSATRVSLDQRSQEELVSFETVKAFQDRLLSGTIVAKSITIHGVGEIGLELLWKTDQPIEDKITMIFSQLMFARRRTVTVFHQKQRSQQPECVLNEGILRLTDKVPMMLKAEPDIHGGPVCFSRSALCRNLAVSEVKSYTFEPNQQLLFPISQEEFREFQRCTSRDLQWLSHLQEGFLKEGLSLWYTDDMKCHIEARTGIITLKSDEPWTLVLTTKKGIEQFIAEIKERDVTFAPNDAFLLTIEEEDVLSALKELDQQEQEVSFYQLMDKVLPPGSRISILGDDDYDFCELDVVPSGVIIRFHGTGTLSYKDSEEMLVHWS